MLTDETLSSVSDSILHEEEVVYEQETPKCIHHDQIEGCIAKIISDVEVEESASAICRFLDLYLEQPYLLDPYLRSWIPRMVRWLLNKAKMHEWDLIMAGSRVIYSFCKVRGAKSISVFFEHEVSDFDSVIRLCKDSISKDLGIDGWQVRYIAILMAAIVLLLPFDIDKLIRKKELSNNGLDYLEEVTRTVKTKLFTCGRERQAAVIFMSCLLRRKDYNGLEDLIREATTRLKNDIDNQSALGLLECICSALKTVVVDIVACIPTVLNDLMDACDEQQNCNNNSLRKIRLKLFCQLVGIVNPNRCINVQIKALYDPDTTVRWTAAKGIAKIAKSLTTISVKNIITNLLQRLTVTLADPFPSISLCNGIALTLGQLSKSSLLPSDLVTKTIEVSGSLLIFETPRGRIAAGMAVRDAACFIIWALARCYPSPLPEVVFPLASTLICVALFDREVSCRRAAAAAFQEIVGRWDCIPFGVELLGKINFFDTHHVRVTYGSIASEIVSFFPIYLEPIVEHLKRRGISNWDREVRNLAAPLLATLANRFDIDLLDDLVKVASNSDDLSAQHGAILTLSYLNFKSKVAIDKVMVIALLLKDIPSKMLGWELIADSVFRLITTICYAESYVMEQEILLHWFKATQQALQSRDDSLHNLIANKTLPAIGRLVSAGSPLVSDFFRGVVLPAADKDRNLNAQRGFALAIGAIPSWLAMERFGPLIRLVIKFIRGGPIIEKRVNAIQSIGNIFGREDLVIANEHSIIHIEVLETLLLAMDDYTVDSRGDIGSIVRLAAMENFPRIYKEKTNYLPLYQGKLIRHVFDKLDKLRKRALALLRTIQSDLALPWDQLEESCFRPQIFFDILKSIDLSGLMDNVLCGLIASAGSVNLIIAEPALGLVTYWLLNGKISYSGLINEMILHYHGRLQRSILLLFDRLLPYHQDSLNDMSGGLIIMFIETANNLRANMHDVLAAVSILHKLSSTNQIASNWILDSGKKHEFTQVRELCHQTIAGRNQ